ncbi:hypothetical protein QO058_15310 [Bosea vestrisii]|uniref:hypothetical protein n=1 Tax=Bosea vestrisii TaxID=151416 RepID=UPI0024E023FC|nr:hypothetical protein [Bosea vestrisii]WID94243.1 hypothetical protein QO058_15310 [Bosea vestrisii]
MRASASITIAILFAVGATQTRAHRAPGGWDYPFECCSEADCARIDASAVREVRSGFVVTIAPGRHPMWPTERREPLVLEISHQKARQSPDGLWHLCINDAGELLCFYAPGGDS